MSLKTSQVVSPALTVTGPEGLPLVGGVEQAAAAKITTTLAVACSALTMVDGRSGLLVRRNRSDSNHDVLLTGEDRDCF
jgi:hypothetical protein